MFPLLLLDPNGGPPGFSQVSAWRQSAGVHGVPMTNQVYFLNQSLRPIRSVQCPVFVLNQGPACLGPWLGLDFMEAQPLPEVDAPRLSANPTFEAVRSPFGSSVRLVGGRGSPRHPRSRCPCGAKPTRCTSSAARRGVILSVGEGKWAEIGEKSLGVIRSHPSF